MDAYELLCEQCEKRPRGEHFQVCDECWAESLAPLMEGK